MTDKVQLEPTIKRFSLSDIETGATPTQQGAFKVAEASSVPSEDAVTLQNAQRVGIAHDRLPVLNVQEVSWGDRLLTQLLHDTPEEKVAYLKQHKGNGYDYAVNPADPQQIIIKKNGNKHWGVIDPRNLTTDEYLPELLENIDSIAQMVSIPAGVLAAAATTGGIQAVRQLIKEGVTPENQMSLAPVVTDAASGAFGGGITSAISYGTKKAGAQVITKTGEILEDAGKAVSKSADGGILGKLGEKLDIVNTPKFIAKEMGATGKQLDPTNPNLLINRVAKLQKNHPEFNAAYKGAWTLKGKFQNLAKLSDDAGESIGQFMQEMGGEAVPIKTILKSKAFTELDQAANTRFVQEGNRLVRVNRATKLQTQKVKKDFLEDLGSMVLGEGEEAKSIMNLYRKGKLVNEDIAKELGAKSNDEALIALIGEKEISLGDAWALRLGRDQIIKYGKQQGQITAKNTVDKYTADAVRESMEAVLKGLPGGKEALKNQELYANLYPVLKTMGGKLGRDAAGLWNPLGLLPGMINSAPRFAAKLGVNLANKVEVRAFVEGLAKGKFPLPEDAIMPKGVTGLTKGLGQISRAAKFNFAEGVLNKDAEAQVLPRTADSYFQNPNLINSLAEKVDDPELLNSMVKTFERGDKESFANMLSMVGSESDDIFETAPYKSLVINEGIPVIMDKYDREQYRQWVEKKVIDPREKYIILQRLNGFNEMTMEPFKPPKDYIELPITKNTTLPPQSTVSKTASSLKKSDTVVLEDGSERQDYDH